MSYIFSSNGNQYTFKKLNNLLINLPQEDGNHLLVRQTINGNPQYSWTSTPIVIKVNDIYSEEYIPPETQLINTVNINFELKKGNYLITSYLQTFNDKLDELFSDCNNIEEVLSKNYFMKMSIFNTNGTDIPIINEPIIDTLNTLKIYSNQEVINIPEDDDYQLLIECPDNYKFLKGISAIKIIFEKFDS